MLRADFLNVVPLDNCAREFYNVTLIHITWNQNTVWCYVPMYWPTTLVRLAVLATYKRGDANAETTSGPMNVLGTTPGNSR